MRPQEISDLGARHGREAADVTLAAFCAGDSETFMQSVLVAVGRRVLELKDLGVGEAEQRAWIVAFNRSARQAFDLAFLKPGGTA